MQRSAKKCKEVLAKYLLSDNDWSNLTTPNVSPFILTEILCDDKKKSEVDFLCVQNLLLNFHQAEFLKIHLVLQKPQKS